MREGQAGGEQWGKRAEPQKRVYGGEYAPLLVLVVTQSLPQP
jgi:hypothetical protein